MITQFNLGQYKTVHYELNQETGYYTKKREQPLKTPVMRLPYELKLAATRSEQIKNNAKQVLHSREKLKNGSYMFMTGLQETEFEDWLLGNDYEFKNGVKVISMVLFHFTENYSNLSVYYFSRFDKGKTALRLEWAKKIIKHLFNNNKN